MSPGTSSEIGRSSVRRAGIVRAAPQRNGGVDHGAQRGHRAVAARFLPGGQRDAKDDHPADQGGGTVVVYEYRERGQLTSIRLTGPPSRRAKLAGQCCPWLAAMRGPQVANRSAASRSVNPASVAASLSRISLASCSAAQDRAGGRDAASDACGSPC